MQLKILDDMTQFYAIGTEWNELLSCCSASHVPFLRHEYLKTWWETLGGGEWEQAKLFTVLAYRDDGRLAGIAPLFYSNNRDAEPALLLLGSIEISDYLDFIANPPDLSPFVDALFNLLASSQAPPWKVLDLYNLAEESPTLDALRISAKAKGWDYSQEQLQPCPYIPLPGDWEQYLANIHKKQRHEIRRKMRRAQDYPIPVHWYFVDNEDKLDSEIDAFLAMMAQDPEKERFLTNLMQKQLRSAIHAAFHAGWLQLSFLEVGGEKAAGYLNFDFAGHIWVYNSGINFEFGQLSPGWVLLGYLLKWANENQREAVDFMRGDEEYKYRFGGINRYVVRATIRRLSR